MAPVHKPAAACRLLKDGKLIEFACDVGRNEAFARADARTEDARGKRILDYVRTPDQREGLQRRLEALLRLPLHEFERVMANDPVKLTGILKADGRKRIVGVPTFTRRCISNLISMILSMTGDHLLPHAAKAYRPGSREAVKNALLDVAKAVRTGRVRYWAKLDITSFFSEMPWWALEDALRHYGYDDQWVKVVMAVVRCPLVRREWGMTIRLPNKRGAQMGLAESATLANMLPYKLDQWFSKRSSQLFYSRYSDDIFIGGSRKSDVVGAVREVQRWSKDYELSLKGVSPDTRAEKLVYDIKNCRIDLLGAEIDQNGAVHMPLAKLKEKLSEIGKRVANLAESRVVKGVSQYGNGGGTHLFDLDDVEETIDGFLSYWEGLDPPGTEKARLLIRKTFPVPVSPRSGGQGVVWIAQLWGVQADGGVEAKIPAVHEPTEPTVTDPPVLMGRGADLNAFQEPGCVEGTEGASGGPEPTFDVEEHARTEFLYTGVAADLFTQAEDERSDEECVSYEVEEVALLHRADGRKTNRFFIPSNDLQRGSVHQDDLEDDHLDADVSEISGAEDDTLQEPPLAAVLENRIVVYLEAERLRWPGEPRCAVGTALVRNGTLMTAPTVAVARGRLESALLQTMLSTCSTRPTELTFVVSSTGLVKALLQRHRRVRAPLMFGLVSELHARGQRVTIVGGVKTPIAIHCAIQDAIRARLGDASTRAVNDQQGCGRLSTMDGPVRSEPRCHLRARNDLE